MPTFKTICLILRKHLGVFGLTLVVGLATSIAYKQQTVTPNLTMNTLPVAIFNKDEHGDISQALSNYLESNLTRIDILETTEAMDDALFFETVDTIITIPQNFSANFQANASQQIQLQSKPDTFSEYYINQLITDFLSNYHYYQQLYPEGDSTEWLAKTQQLLENKGDVHFDATYATQQKLTATSQTFSMLAYTLFTCIFSIVTLIMLKFNQKEIQQRTRCAPVSKRQLAQQQLISQLILCFVVWLLFVGLTILISDIDWNAQLGWLLLNSLGLLLVAVTFSHLMGGLLTNPQAISAISNIVILGGAFISGAFVPAKYLPDAVINIASFTPSYWYVKNTNLICSTVTQTSAFKQEFFAQLGILLLFALIFFLATLLTKKESWSFKNLRAAK